MTALYTDPETRDVRYVDFLADSESGLAGRRSQRPPPYRKGRGRGRGDVKEGGPAS